MSTEVLKNQQDYQRTFIAYGGEALESGSMDVRDLAPALLGVGQLLEAGNRALNHDRANVAVLVRSDFQRGSFVVSLELSQAIAEGAKKILAGGQPLADLKVILDVVGMLGNATATVGGGIAVGFWKFLSWLRDRKIEKAEPAPAAGLSTITVTGGESITVNNTIVLLAQDDEVRGAAARIVRPLLQPGINDFKAGADRSAMLSLVTRDDAAAIQQAALPAVADPNVLQDSEYVTLWEVKRPYFGDGHRWGFASGHQAFGAEIHDSRFLERVTARQYSFAMGDALRVRVRTRVTRVDGKLVPRHDVLEVLDVIQARVAEQRSLLSDMDASASHS